MGVGDSFKKRIHSLAKRVDVHPSQDPNIYYIKSIGDMSCYEYYKKHDPRRVEGKEVVWDPKFAAWLDSLPPTKPDHEREAWFREMKSKDPDNPLWELFGIK